jgi:glycosyltransferase involved in cell wall biosynthesis
VTSRLVLAYPGRLDLKTGGYAYDRHLISGLQGLGWEVEALGLGDGFPAPSEEVLAEAERRLAQLPNQTLVLIDGLAFGVLDAWAEREADRLAIVALVHHPLALETGIQPAAARLLEASERKALRFARHVIVTSSETARTLTASYDVPRARMTVALPGTEKRALASSANVPLHILSVGSLTRRKGHDILFSALDAIRDLEWRASIIGSPDLDPATAADLRAQVTRLDLTDRVTLHGEVSDVAVELASADIFALASRYEGYGMVFAEAMAQGLPIVACHAGAVPEVVPPDAGILVPVDDVAAFASALRDLIEDPVMRQDRARAAARAGADLPGWQDTARTVSCCLKGTQ